MEVSKQLSNVISNTISYTHTLHVCMQEEAEGEG